MAQTAAWGLHRDGGDAVTNAVARFADQVRRHARAFPRGCAKDATVGGRCSLCQAWRVWAQHPEWGTLPPRWWAWHQIDEQLD